ncbi:hypothetical protein CL632_02915 [bacterium]|nr:hypothetical protein [bacterium]|tara:strand:+ start:19357 stop:20028 length:672 start_codon:yes stop_codon:yes gene_type:complete
MHTSIQSKWIIQSTLWIFNGFFLGKVLGKENVPSKGAFILAANHVSIPDSWLLINILLKKHEREVWFISRDDIWWGTWFTSKVVSPLLGSLLLVDWRNPKQVLDQAKEILKRGWVVGIHPEGTRNTDPKALCLGKTGAARLALETGLPVVPAGYFGPSISTLWDVFYEFALKRNRAKIVFGKTMDFSEYKNKEITRDLLYEVTDKIMIEIGNLSNKKPRLHQT